MKTSEKIFALLVLVLVMIIAQYFFGYKTDRLVKTLSGPLNVITSSNTEVKSELASLKNELDKLAFEVSKVSPAAVGHVHHTVRYFMIRAQGGQMPPNGIVLIGDSITEGLFFDRICGIPVLNAGIGGAGVTMFVDFVDEVVAKTKPSVVVIALGVNDAHAKTGSEEAYVAEWVKFYSKIVQSVKKGKAEPVLMTILPVEKDMDLGSRYFNSNQIKMMNAKIADLAQRGNCVVIDSYATFADSEGFTKKGSTVDGVHLTPKSYEIWKSDIRKGVAMALEKKGLKYATE
jgi:lysophospholipase L1-like esterase